MVTEAAALPGIAGLLDPFTASELDQALAKLPNGRPIGQAIVDSWIAAFHAKQPTEVDDENLFNRPLHPAIKAAFEAIKAHAQASTTVLDACMHIIENSGWGTMQEIAMKQASAVDFEATIREADLDKLRRFMRRMIEMRLQKATFDPHFGTASARFVEACRNIANDTTSPRLASLIKRLFAETALATELNVEAGVAASAAEQA